MNDHSNFSDLSDEQLRQLVTDAQSALAARTEKPGPRRYFESFSSYNARRYSKPWIARITAWPVGGRAEMQWGSYLGDDSGGEAEIMALPGDIIRYGQKDTRGNGGSSEWAVAKEDGTLEIVDQAAARQAYKGAL